MTLVIQRVPAPFGDLSDPAAAASWFRSINADKDGPVCTENPIRID